MSIRWRAVTCIHSASLISRTGKSEDRCFCVTLLHVFIRLVWVIDVVFTKPFADMDIKEQGWNLLRRVSPTLVQPSPLDELDYGHLAETSALRRIFGVVDGNPAVGVGHIDVVASLVKGLALTRGYQLGEETT